MVEESGVPARMTRRTAWLWGAVALVAVVVAVIVYLAATSGSSAAPNGDGGGTTGPTPSASSAAPTDEPSGEPTDEPTDQPSGQPTPGPAVPTSSTMPELPPVAPEKPADNGQGLVAEITAMKSVQGEAVQPGDIAGPAVQFRLTLTNDTDADVDLGLIAVNAYLGEERTPAIGLVKPGGAPFEGVLEPGDSAKGVYVYNIPEDQRDDVTLTVDYRAGQPAFVFRGRVG